MPILLSSGEGMSLQCVCCLADIVEGESSEGMQCGHMFHDDCIRRYMQVKGLQNFKDLACPTCKNTGWDCDRLEAEQRELLTAQPPTAAMAAEIVALFEESPPGPSHAEEAEASAAEAEASAAAAEAEASASVPDFDAEARSSAVQEAPDSTVHSGPIETFLVPALAMPIQTKMAQEGFQIECVNAWNSHEQDQQVMCVDCQEPCVKYRVKSKGQGTFVCRKCDYVHTRLYRDEGAGYRKILCEMPPAELKDFFTKAKDMNSKDQKAWLDSKKEKWSVRERTFSNGGSFKPLSVWATDGFDPVIIAEKSLPQDVMPDRMWGMVYRVPILSVNVQGSDGKRSFSSATAVAKPTSVAKRLKMLENCSDEGRNAQQDPDNLSNPSTSDASTSSDSKLNSAQKRARKKSKIAKKKAKCERKNAKKEKVKQVQVARDQKAAEKRIQQDEKQTSNAAKKAEQQVRLTCVSTSKKLDSAIASVEKTLRTPGAVCLGEEMSVPLKRMQEQLVQLKAYVDGFLYGREDWQAFTLSTDLTKLVADVKKHEAVFHFNVRTFAPA